MIDSFGISPVNVLTNESSMATPKLPTCLVSKSHEIDFKKEDACRVSERVPSKPMLLDI